MKPIEAAEKLQGSIDGHEIRIEIFELAIEALLQMEERNMPCDYCNFTNYLEGAWGDFKIGRKISRGIIQYATTVTTALSNKGLVSLYYNEDSGKKQVTVEKVRYCPMCGRKLTEMQDGPT